MKYTVFKILEWILFIGFAIIAGWFASGVIEHFFSRKSSFSQHEEEVTKYPVVVIKAPDNQINVKINYRSRGMMSSQHQKLEIGENQFQNDKNNKTEKVILDILENNQGRRFFRIIHATPIFKKKIPSGYIKIYVKVEKKNGSSYDWVQFHLTSREKSPGFIDGWRDGLSMLIPISKNTKMIYNIQPRMTKYLEPLGKCQKEAYYECIASLIDTTEFKDCSNKCIPNVFSNMGKNYSTAFCQNDTSNQQCMFANMFEQEIVSNCKKSCSNLEYFGEIFINKPDQSDKEDWNLYYLHYRLVNQDFKAKVYEEYLVYDAIGMTGSVGGTLGN